LIRSVAKSQQNFDSNSCKMEQMDMPHRLECYG